MVCLMCEVSGEHHLTVLVTDVYNSLYKINIARLLGFFFWGGLGSHFKDYLKTFGVLFSVFF